MTDDDCKQHVVQAAVPRLGDTFPNFTADTTHGTIKFHDWLGSSWGLLLSLLFIFLAKIGVAVVVRGANDQHDIGLLCSHPADFTPVCTTELSYLIKILPELAKRDVKVIAVSCDDTASHHGWTPDVQELAGTKGDFPYPIIADAKRDLAVSLGMLDGVAKDAAGLPAAARAVFIIGPDKKLKLSILYPATTGRNFDEILRVIDSLQLTANYRVATPANWKQGGDVMVTPAVKPEEIPKLFPKVCRRRFIIIKQSKRVSHRNRA